MQGESIARSVVSLAGAQRLIEAALSEGKRRGADVAVAVVDPAGHIVASARMDGARLHATDIAHGKATAAALYGKPSADFDAKVMENPTWVSHLIRFGGRIIPNGGGAPIIRDGHVIGAVGVTGSSTSGDHEIALIAVKGLD